MTSARKRAEEALARLDRWDAKYRPRTVEIDADDLRSLLAEEDERGITETAPLTPEQYRYLASRPDPTAPPAADEVREAAFARFGRALLPKWWDDGNPGDIDGGDAQEAAEACGLWHHVERHSDDVECEWCGNDGSPCGELTEVGLSAIAARGGA